MPPLVSLLVILLFGLALMITNYLAYERAVRNIYSQQRAEARQKAWQEKKRRVFRSPWE